MKALRIFVWLLAIVFLAGLAMSADVMAKDSKSKSKKGKSYTLRQSHFKELDGITDKQLKQLEVIFKTSKQGEKLKELRKKKDGGDKKAKKEYYAFKKVLEKEALDILTDKQKKQAMELKKELRKESDAKKKKK